MLAVPKASQLRKATIVVGPPEDRSKDRFISKELFNTKGVKVVCGGTTSKIIARETHRDLQVDLTTLTGLVPPCGLIEGVDLVTEGALTLAATVKLLKSIQYVSDIPGKDGASKLAKVLLIADEIRFIVGRAANPAYENADLPIDHEFKLRLIDSLKDVLMERGKTITVEYY